MGARKTSEKGGKNPLNKEQKAAVSAKLKEYIAENFDMDIGNLQAAVFADYIAENIGAYFYNKAVADSLSFMAERVEDLYLLMKDEE